MAVKLVKSHDIAATSAEHPVEFWRLSTLKAATDDEADAIVQLTLNGGRSLAANSCGLLQLKYLRADNASDDKVGVGTLEMHASRMFLCMRESSCMDECDWLRLMKQHIVRTYKTY
jgi:hypothetical protein